MQDSMGKKYFGLYHIQQKGMPKSKCQKTGQRRKPNKRWFRLLHVRFSNIQALKFLINLSENRTVRISGIQAFKPQLSINRTKNVQKSNILRPNRAYLRSVFRNCSKSKLNCLVYGHNIPFSDRFFCPKSEQNCLNFRCLNTEPTENETEVEHPRTKLVQILALHCKSHQGWFQI